MPPKTINQVNTITTSSITTGAATTATFNPNTYTMTTSPCTIYGTSLPQGILNPSNIGNTTFKLSPFKQMELSFEGNIEQLNELSKIFGEKNRTKEIEIIKVEILNPNKVLRFTFNDNTTIKTICSEEDTFDFKFAFFIAFAKKLFKDTYTPEGIFQKAKEMQYMKIWIKKVNKSIKLFEQGQKEKELKDQKEKELKIIKKRKIEKKIARKEKKRQEKINEITEAIQKATNPFNNIHIQNNYE